MTGIFHVDVPEFRCRLNFCFPAGSKKIQRRILEFVLEFGEFRGWNRGNGSTRIGVGLGWFVAELCGGESYQDFFANTMRDGAFESGKLKVFWKCLKRHASFRKSRAY